MSKIFILYSNGSLACWDQLLHAGKRNDNNNHLSCSFTKKLYYVKLSRPDDKLFFKFIFVLLFVIN